MASSSGVSKNTIPILVGNQAPKKLSPDMGPDLTYSARYKSPHHAATEQYRSHLDPTWLFLPVQVVNVSIQDDARYLAEV